MTKYRIAADGKTRTFHVEIQYKTPSVLAEHVWVKAHYGISHFNESEINQFPTKWAAKHFVKNVLQKREQQEIIDDQWEKDQGYEYL